MKKWSLCLLSLLAACGQGGGGGGGGAPGATCNALSTSKSSTLAEVADPFAAGRKVVIEEDGGPNVPKRDSQNRRTFAAGTQLTVQLAENCPARGEISAQVKQDSAEAESADASPSGVRDYTWTLAQDLTEEQIQEMANKDDCVRGVANNAPLQVTVDDDQFEQPLMDAHQLAADPLLGQQTHFQALGITAEKSSIITGQSAGRPSVVAILDTGTDIDHEDIKGVVWTNDDEIPDNKIDDDKNGFVDDVHGWNFASGNANPRPASAGASHGTHVAGLAAAQANNGVGVAGVHGTNVKLMALNVFGGGSGASTSDVTNAIRYAADNGADVINMSLSGPGKSAAYQSAIGYAVKKGTVVIAAAGNQKKKISEATFQSPAGYGPEFPGMMAVASVDVANALNPSTFTNYSSAFVEIGAPGSEDSKTGRGLMSTMPGNKYGRMQGTSMASPVVAGGVAFAVARLRANGYAADPAGIEELLRNTGQKVPAMSDKVTDGRVMNLGNASDFLQSACR